ncbi:toxin [Streptomyces sp. NPDC000594]|uniref:toxin n=1 Tax=Streptomyces sp. NPDC000594 TaxID=3154261 RepID=UPI00332B3F77
MSVREMKKFLGALGRLAAKEISVPAEPHVVMDAFCTAMTVRTGRPIQLVFRAFPDAVGVSGLRLALEDRSVIVVEERVPPAAQLVILGHELWHEHQGDCGHHLGTASAAARSAPEDPTAVERAVQQILAQTEVPQEALQAVAARAESSDSHETDAETFGLLFGSRVRTWLTGRYARGGATTTTVEGRITASLSGRHGIL